MSDVVMAAGSPRSPAEILAQLVTLQERYRQLKLAGATGMFAGTTTRDDVEAQLLVVCGGIVLCQWALGMPLDPPVELMRAGWQPSPGFVL